MSYLYDPDLEFLQFCSNEDLEIMVNYLRMNKNSSEEKFDWSPIANEIQKLGEDSLKEVFINRGIYYKDILIDICKKLDVVFNSNYSTEKIEGCLLEKIKNSSVLYIDKENDIYTPLIPTCIYIAYIRHNYSTKVNTKE